MKKRYNGEENSYITSEDSNSGMKEARDRDEADAEYENDRLKKRAMERSRILQQDISSGSDFKGRPQDEGYRPNAGTARDRAMLEGAYDSGKITESGDQGFGGPGSSRTVKATPKAMPKSTADSEITRMKNRAKSAEMPSGSPGRGKSAEMPADVTKMSVADRAKRSREMARSGSGTTDKRSVGERLKSAFGMKSGGSVSSASKRADGIATKGKTRGRMC
jgi:hypothetical protein